MDDDVLDEPGSQESSDAPDDWEQRLDDNWEQRLNDFDSDEEQVPEDALYTGDWAEACVEEDDDLDLKLHALQSQYQAPTTSTHEPIESPEIKTAPHNKGPINKYAANEMLPIMPFKEDILKRVRCQRVTCIRGDTGCGKSTMVPQFIMEDAESNAPLYPRPVKIVVSQPRRLAAKSLAERVATNRGENVGDSVGYKMAYDYCCTTETKLFYVTVGSLLQSLVRNPSSFASYTHVILDEVHMRELDSDLLSLVIKLLSNDVMEEVKIIIMSASIQGDMFPRYFDPDFDPESTLYVGGKCYPVEMIYLEDFDHYFGSMMSIKNKLDVLNAVSALNHKPLKFYKEKETSRRDESGEESDEDEVVYEHSAMVFERVHKLLDEMLRKKHIKQALDKTVKSLFPNVYSELCVAVVKACAKPGESILVFRSGKPEIEELFDMLIEYERPCQLGWKCPIRLFALHSMIPFDDQMEVFNTPHPGIAHVILATNIAENSLTLPGVRVVIDFGFHKQMVYSNLQRVSHLLKVRCSKASCEQRAGRAGRVFEGRCIRIFTRDCYEKLPEFGKPDIQTAALDKCVLRVKQIGKYFQGYRPHDLLKQTIEPPSMKNFKEAVRTLADIGCIKANDEMSDMTILGALAVNLPTTVRLARLILYGILFHCPCDALVMAAALQSKDPFTLPTKLVMKDSGTFCSSVKKSYQFRSYYDEGQYNEPWMLLNMVIDWICYYHDKLRMGNRRGRFQDRVTDTSKYREEFCRKKAVAAKRLVQVENTLKSLISPTLNVLSERCYARRKIQALMRYLPGSEYTRRNVGAPYRVEQGLDSRDLSELFTEDIWVINATLCAAFSPVILEGKPLQLYKIANGDVDLTADDMVKGMQASGIDPKRSVFLRVPEELVKKPEMAQKVITRICYPVKTAHLQDEKYSLEFREDHKQGIIRDIPQEVHELHMYTEGRGGIQVEISAEDAAELSLEDDTRRVRLSAPLQPHKIIWRALSWCGKPLTDKTITFRASTCWRNPIGFACDIDRGTHYAVAYSLTASSKHSGLVEGVSILPSDNNNLLAIALMLAFQPAHFHINLCISCRERRVIYAEMFEYLLQFSKESPLAPRLLKAVNHMRAMISQVFNECSEELDVDVNLPESLKEVLQAVPFSMQDNGHLQEVKTASETDQTSDGNESEEDCGNGEVPSDVFIKHDPFAAQKELGDGEDPEPLDGNNKAQCSRDDNFVLLKPYNTESLEKLFDFISRSDFVTNDNGKHDATDDDSDNVEAEVCCTREEKLAAQIKRLIKQSDDSAVQLMSLDNVPVIRDLLKEIRKTSPQLKLTDFLKDHQAFDVTEDPTAVPPGIIVRRVELHYTEEERLEAEKGLCDALIGYLFKQGNRLQRVEHMATCQSIKSLLQKAGDGDFEDDQTLLLFLDDHDDIFEVLPYEAIADAEFRLKKTANLFFDSRMCTLVSNIGSHSTEERISTSDDEGIDDSMEWSSSDSESSVDSDALHIPVPSQFKPKRPIVDKSVVPESSDTIRSKSPESVTAMETNNGQVMKELPSQGLITEELDAKPAVMFCGEKVPETGETSREREPGKQIIRRLTRRLAHALGLLLNSKDNAPQKIKAIVTGNNHISQCLQQVEPELCRSASKEDALLQFIVTHNEFEVVGVGGGKAMRLKGITKRNGVGGGKAIRLKGIMKNKGRRKSKGKDRDILGNPRSFSVVRSLSPRKRSWEFTLVRPGSKERYDRKRPWDSEDEISEWFPNLDQPL